MVGNFTAGELTHQQRNAVVLGLDARRNSDRLVDGDAQPIDSGIDMQRRAAAPGFHIDEGIPLGELGGAVDDRPQRGVGKRLRRARHQPVEHVDGACRRDRPYAAALGDVGDEEGPAPGLRQLGGNLLEAAAIAVSLDHGRAFDRHRRAREPFPIGLDGGKVDGQDGPGLGFGRAGGRHSCGLQGGIVGGHGRVMTGGRAPV